MSWWSDLWLFEGFSTLAESLGKDAFDPQLKAQERSLLDVHEVIM